MPPAFRAVSTATTGTGAGVTTLEVAIPTSGAGGDVKPYDLAYLWWSEVFGGLITGLATPAGWTELLAPQSILSSTQAIALAYKYLVTADIGANTGFGTLGSNRRQNLSVTVYKSAVHDSVSSLSSSATGTTPPPVPGIDPVALDCMLASFAALNHTSADINLITSTPASSPAWVERADFGTSVTAAVNHGSQEVQERQESGGGAFSATTFTASHSIQYGAVTVALAAAVVPYLVRAPINW